MNNIPPHRAPSDAALAQRLFSPRSIALIGASDDVNKTAGRPLLYLRRAGFAGAIYPINPRRDEVQGEPAWRSVAELPEVPEHVYILTPTESVYDAVLECAQAGVKVVTILASGFAETGPAGVALEQSLLVVARRFGMRIVGPSSLGVVNPSNGFMLTANAAFAEPDFPRGKLFVASQSGSMIGALVSRGKAKGLGFAGLISVGGEVDLSVGEICAATLDDDSIDGYLLFLESLRQAPRLRAFAIEAARRGKPVIAYKLGRSQAAAAMTATHTGALAGEDDVADAFLRDSGIVRVKFLESLLECFALAKRVPLSRPSRPAQIGVVTTTGGGAAMVVDELGIRNLTVQTPSEATMLKVRAAGIAASAGPVLDLTLAGAKYDIMKAALDTYLAAPEFDMVVAVVGSSARFAPHLAVKPIIDCADHAKPLIAMLVPEANEANLALTQAGVPCFRTPEACGDSVAATLGRRTWLLENSMLDAVMLARSTNAAAEWQAALTTGTNPRRMLSEDKAYQLLAEIGLRHAPFVTLDLPAFLPANLPVHHEPATAAEPLELPFEFPVAVKICSDRVAHKTELGGVLLNVATAPELRVALATLRGNLDRSAPAQVVAGPADTPHRTGARQAPAKALVQAMTTGLAEVLIGYRVDPQAGPLVLLAAGGIWAEIARDRSIRLAPITLATAFEMIDEVRMLKTLTGLRGKPKGDLAALAQSLCDLSQLARRPEMAVSEAEINPLMVMPQGQGVIAVDAVVWQSP